jgi:hypothetical protein
MAEPKSKATESDVRAAERQAEELADTSSDAAHSTYSRVDAQREGEINPPPGPQTQQVRGKPSEGGGTAFSADR